MKKILALFSAVVMVCSLCAITGCTLFDVGEIEWVQKPETVYALNGQEELKFSVKVTIDGREETVQYPSSDTKLKVEGFDITSTGTKTATVKYGDKLQLTFQYDVLDTGFAGGTGSEVNPYIVTTVAQFQKLLDQKTFNYYKLGNSIDFENETLRMANLGDFFANKEEASAGCWTGEIDGNNYSLLNINKVVGPDGTPVGKHNELFGFVGALNRPFTLKNITINYAATGVDAVCSLIGSNCDQGELTFENVKLTGYLDAQYIPNGNNSALISTLNDGKGLFKSITFKNVENSVKILNSHATATASGFFVIHTGTQVASGSKVVFDGCKFNGTIEGAAEGGAAAFATVKTRGSLDWLSFKNCSIEGATLVKTNNSDPAAVFVTNNNLDTINGIDSITGNATVKTLRTVTFGNVNGNEVTVSCDGAKSYKAYASQAIVYWGANGSGVIKPCIGSFYDGKITLPTIIVDNVTNNLEDLKNNDDAKYGTRLIREESDGSIVYYSRSLFKSVTKNTTLIVVAFDENGNAIAVGKKALGKSIFEAKADNVQ